MIIYLLPIRSPWGEWQRWRRNQIHRSDQWIELKRRNEEGRERLKEILGATFVRLMFVSPKMATDSGRDSSQANAPLLISFLTLTHQTPTHQWIEMYSKKFSTNIILGALGGRAGPWKSLPCHPRSSNSARDLEIGGMLCAYISVMSRFLRDDQLRRGDWAYNNACWLAHLITNPRVQTFSWYCTSTRRDYHLSDCPSSILCLPKDYHEAPT